MIPEALMVFAKAPEAGRVKTRLNWPGEQAAALHAAFVLDALDRHRQEGRSMTLWTAGDVDHPFWARCGDCARRTQLGNNLGARMEYAFRVTLAEHERVVIIGTDSPTLPLDYLDAAFKALETYPVVLGPAEDGGYVLLGMSQQLYSIFPEDMPWGHSTVLERTVQCLNAMGVDFLTLRPWYDVDHPEDVQRLYTELAAHRGEDPYFHSRTFEVLRAIFQGAERAQ